MTAIIDRREGARPAADARAGRARNAVGLGIAMLLLMTVGGCARLEGPWAAPEAAEADPAAAAAVASQGKPPQVLGLDPDTLATLLGEPTLVRRDPPAEVWQYRGSTCILDLFVYEDPEGQRVLYAEARTGAAEPTATEACIGSLLAARTQGQTS